MDPGHGRNTSRYLLTCLALCREEVLNCAGGDVCCTCCLPTKAQNELLSLNVEFWAAHVQEHKFLPLALFSMSRSWVGG